MTLLSRVHQAEAEGGILRVRDDAWMLEEPQIRYWQSHAEGHACAIDAGKPQARQGELRSACRSVFAEQQWQGRSGETKDRLEKELIDVVFGLGPLQEPCGRRNRDGNHGERNGCGFH